MPSLIDEGHVALHDADADAARRALRDPELSGEFFAPENVGKIMSTAAAMAR